MSNEGKIFKKVVKKDFSISLKYRENPTEFVNNTLTLLEEIDTLENELNTKIREYSENKLYTVDGTFPRRYTVDALYD